MKQLIIIVLTAAVAVAAYMTNLRPGQRPASPALAHVVNSDNYYLFSTTILA